VVETAPAEKNDSGERWRTAVRSVNIEKHYTYKIKKLAQRGERERERERERTSKITNTIQQQTKDRIFFPLKPNQNPAKKSNNMIQ
jgi:hypothetical protein